MRAGIEPGDRAGKGPEPVRGHELGRRLSLIRTWTWLGPESEVSAGTESGLIRGQRKEWVVA